MFRGFQGKDPSCLVLRLKSDGPVQVWRKKGISYTSKGSPVFCGKKPGTRLHPRRPTLLNNRFYGDGTRTAFSSLSNTQQNEQYSCRRAQPDDFFFVGSTSINSSYSAVHLCSWATPCTVLAQLFVQLSNGRDQRTGPPRSFPRCFSQIKFPNILVDTMQEEQKSMGNHRSWSLAEGQ